MKGCEMPSLKPKLKGEHGLAVCQACEEVRDLLLMSSTHIPIQPILLGQHFAVQRQDLFDRIAQNLAQQRRLHGDFAVVFADDIQHAVDPLALEAFGVRSAIAVLLAIPRRPVLRLPIGGFVTQFLAVLLHAVLELLVEDWCSVCVGLESVRIDLGRQLIQ